MHVFIAGSGKLASELLSTMAVDPPSQVQRWTGAWPESKPSIVLHAGSGRELEDILAFCEASRSVLVELATGSDLTRRTPACTVVVCPNTNILMLKVMAMLRRSGLLFAGCRIGITESHQAAKHSTPGTAISMADALGVPAGQIVSVRDPRQQQAALGIPPEHLDRHAVHVISIEDGPCQVSLTTRVHGESPYADGVSRIVRSIRADPLPAGVHAIEQLVERGWV